jgi:hypothetical protein
MLLLGPWSEQVLRPNNVAEYRKVAFRLGFGFQSVTLRALCHSVRLLLWPCRPRSFDAAYHLVGEN